MALGTINPAEYEQLLVEKIKSTTQMFHELNLPEAIVYPSSPTHYRYRAEFRIWHDGDDMYHIMFNPTDKSRIRIDEWLPAGPLIYQLMPNLINALKTSDILRRKLFQIDYLSTLSGEILVSLIYHRQLDEAWIAAANELKAQLSEKFNIQFIGRARKQKLLLDCDYVTESLNVEGNTLVYQQIENSFTQPNPHINIDMLTWARNLDHEAETDLLELYCGNGNFTLALADKFHRVLATEIAKSSIRSAELNRDTNKIDNVDFIRCASEDFSDAYNRNETSFKKVDLSAYNFKTVLVDPPRAGLDEATMTLVKQFNNIIYVSCNPETLKHNLENLTQTHDVVNFALFDQFPYTHHIESGVFLTRKKAV